MTASNTWSERILRVTDHIQANLETELSPAELGKIAGFSPHHFHRVFRGMVGESVMGFVRRLRLERGAQRLKYEDTPVTDVALASGYQSHEAFTRAFRGRFGTSPSEFRSQQRATTDRANLQLGNAPARTCLCRRFVGSYNECAQSWAELEAIVGQHQLFEGRGGSFGLVYDDPEVTAAAQLRYDACIEFEPGALRAPPPDGTTVRTIPAGRYAIATHLGPYEALAETYVMLLGQWLPHRDMELADEPVVEHYLNEPLTTPPADLVTEICVRIR